MDVLARQHTPKDVLDTLSNPSKELNELYGDTINRISDDHDKELALKALSWVAYASRPLSATELLYALSKPCEDGQWRRDALPDLDIVLSICEGLLIMDEDRKVVRLIRES
jgi:hypothetical protein